MDEKHRNSSGPLVGTRDPEPSSGRYASVRREGCGCRRHQKKQSEEPQTCEIPSHSIITPCTLYRFEQDSPRRKKTARDSRFFRSGRRAGYVAPEKGTKITFVLERKRGTDPRVQVHLLRSCTQEAQRPPDPGRPLAAPSISPFRDASGGVPSATVSHGRA